MTTNEFFTLILSGELSDFDIYNQVQNLTDNFDENKLNLLWNEYWNYLNRGKSRSTFISSLDNYFPEDPFEYSFYQLGILLSEKIESIENDKYDRDQSIFRKSSINILDNKYMTEQDFEPLTVSEKIEYLNLWLRNTKQKRAKLKTRLTTALSYGVEFPTKQEIEIYGENGDLSAYKFKERQHESKVKRLKHELKRQEEALQDLKAELEYWQAQNKNRSSKSDAKQKQPLNPFNKYLYSDKSETIKFFELVNSGEFSDLDIHNHIQQLTDGYDVDKLNLLCNDFDSYIFEKYEMGSTSYDIEKKIAEWQDKGRELPIKGDEKNKYHLLYIRDHFLRERYGEPVSDEEFEEQLDELFGHDRNNLPEIDQNVLLGGFYFTSENTNLNNLKGTLVDLKRKHTSSVYRFDGQPEELKVNSQHINWYHSDSLKPFIEALKQHDLIAERETDHIIKDHFKPHRERNRKPEPIIWLEYQNQLVYLFRKLYEKYFVNPSGKEWQMVSEHFIKENGEKLNVPSLTSEAHSQKNGDLPASTTVIDRIIQGLLE